MKKIYLSFLALITLLLASLSSKQYLTIHAQGSAVPELTTVNITKLQADSFPNGSLTNSDGSAKTLDQLSQELGSTVTGLDGVTFTYYEIDEATYNSYKDGTIPTTAPSSGGTALPVTSNGGLTTWQHTTEKDSNGNPIPSYYVVYETGQPDTVSAGVAVPFVIAFPMANPDGTGYLDNVNIYPKNITSDVPTIAKSVDTLNGTQGNYNIGQEFSYHLKSTIPTNIDAYESFVITDQLDAALTFKSATVSVNGVSLASGTDYTLTPEVDTAGANISLTLTQSGLTKLKENVGTTPTAATDLANVTTAGGFLDVEVKAIINDTAAMGSEIPNNFTLSYDNTTNGTGDPKTLTSNEVNVHTGGKIFTKIAGDSSTTGLLGAQFTIQAGTENLQWTPELAAANKDALIAGKFMVDGKPSTQADPAPTGDVILLSDQDGKFEIKGLAYGDYSLTETVAPAGYVKLEGPIAFTVDATSYTTNQDVVNNVNPSIPNTGGIGSVIFIIVGLLLMLMAYKGYKRYVKE